MGEHTGGDEDGVEPVENTATETAPPGSPGPGWWMASDGHWYPPESNPGTTSGQPVSMEKKTADERKALLAHTVVGLVAQGARIESQSDFQVVLVNGKPVNHLLHLVLTLVTCFIWSIVWLVLALTQGEKRSIATVDEYGNVSVQRLN
jgi:hypothetical protein